MAGLRYTAPHQIYCNSCNYGFQSLRPTYRGGGGRKTGNDAFKTGSNFLNPGTADTGSNQDQFNNNYFTVPNYANAIADVSTPTSFIPAPGIDRNSFGGPKYRDIDLNLGKAFGLPKIRVIGEDAKLEVKANVLNVFNLLNIDHPTSLNNNIASSNLGQAQRALGARTIDFQARFSF